MGIKHFFYWFLRNHKDCITTVPTKYPINSKNIVVDTLALDLNGIFHPAGSENIQVWSTCAQTEAVTETQEKKSKIDTNPEIRVFQRSMRNYK